MLNSKVCVFSSYEQSSGELDGKTMTPCADTKTAASRTERLSQGAHSWHEEDMQVVAQRGSINWANQTQCKRVRQMGPKIKHKHSSSHSCLNGGVCAITHREVSNITTMDHIPALVTLTLKMLLSLSSALSLDPLAHLLLACSCLIECKMPKKCQIYVMPEMYITSTYNIYIHQRFPYGVIPVWPSWEKKTKVCGMDYLARPVATHQSNRSLS